MLPEINLVVPAIVLMLIGALLSAFAFLGLPWLWAIIKPLIQLISA